MSETKRVWPFLWLARMSFDDVGLRLLCMGSQFIAGRQYLDRGCNVQMRRFLAGRTSNSGQVQAPSTGTSDGLPCIFPGEGFYTCYFCTSDPMWFGG